MYRLLEKSMDSVLLSNTDAIVRSNNKHTSVGHSLYRKYGYNFNVCMFIASSFLFLIYFENMMRMRLLLAHVSGAQNTYT